MGWEAAVASAFGIAAQFIKWAYEIKLRRSQERDVQWGPSTIQEDWFAPGMLQQQSPTILDLGALPHDHTDSDGHSLETGTAALHAPAIALYRSAGFVSCDAFADYLSSPYNQFFRLDL